MYATYKCEKCGEFVEYKKEYKIDFPDEIHTSCKDRPTFENEFIPDPILMESDELQFSNDKICVFKRTWEKANPHIEVAEGTVGNAKNGYSKTIGGYNPAPSTPMKPRMSMFNDKGGA